MTRGKTGFVMAAIALWGCADPEAPGGPIYGLLGYACLDDADIACDGAEPGPQESTEGDYFMLGVGARFDVQEHVAQISTNVFAEDGIVVEALAPGIGVVVGASGAYAHFEVRDVAAFVVSQGADGSYVDAVTDPITVSDVALLRVTATDADGNLLGGAYDVEWTSGDETLVALRGRRASVVELTANMPGTTTLTLRVGTVEQELNIDVPAN